MVNITDTEYENGPNYVYFILYIIPIGTICGNVFVCLAVTVERRLRNRFNLFLVSLAISDMLCAVLIMPKSAWELIYGTKNDNIVLCLIWYSLDIFFTATTIIHLCVISLDRYLALRAPLMSTGKFRDTIGSRLCGRIAIAWLISFFIAGPLFVIAYNNGTQDDSYKGCGPNSKEFVITATVVTFILPLCIMIITYLLTIRTLKRQMREAKEAQLYVNTINQISGNNNRSSTIRLSKIQRKMSGKQEMDIVPSGYTYHKKSSAGGTPFKSSSTKLSLENGTARSIIGSMRLKRDGYNTTGELRRTSSEKSGMLSPVKESPTLSNGPVIKGLEVEDMSTCKNNESSTNLDSSIPQEERKNVNHVLGKHRFRSAVQQIRINIENLSHHSPTKLFQQKVEKQHKKFELWRIVREYKEMMENEDRNLELEWASADCSFEHDETSSNIHGELLNLPDSRRSTIESGIGQNETSPSKRKIKSSPIKMNKLSTSPRKIRHASIVERFQNYSKNRNQHKHTIERIHKGKRAMQVIGVLFGVFVTCYLPFFTIYLINVLCDTCGGWTDEWISRIEWLGYIGSMLNPFVYHFFNPAFRRTFRRILHCDFNRKKNHDYRAEWRAKK